MPDHLVNADCDDRTLVAVYVAGMSGDLAGMARRAGLHTLGFLLEMVQIEAEDATRRRSLPTREPSHQGE